MLTNIIKKAAKPIMSKAAPYVPVVGSVYGFGKACIQVHNATTPQGLKVIFYKRLTQK